ncbi:MAG: hypothetical protein JWL90_693 [Chthoniobacteraceae bacterium]|nr:hypothetical protein [Chthoniobacteraceae bacterium]
MMGVKLSFSFLSDTNDVPTALSFAFQTRKALKIKAADGGGFEPPVPVKAHTLSRRAQSTTLSPIQTVTSAEMAEECLY